MKKVPLLLAAACLLGATHFIFLNRAPEVLIEIEAMSPQELHHLGWETAPSTGLSVVGIGDMVYLSAHETSGEEILTYAWSLTPPAGSSATLDSTATPWTTFRPDISGNFTVGLTATTASGTSSVSVVIVSAEYVGVGTVGGFTPDAEAGQCAACHRDQEADWSETGHATFFEEAIDGLQSDHYNAECITCHTLGYNDDPLAVNGGFDDVAAATGWTFPATLQPGNWDDIVENYPALAHLANIQCESCHGPGSLHKGDVAGIDLSLDAGVCARCHDEEPYHRRPAQWANSKHATGTSFARGTSTSCAPCHSGWGFVNKVDPASDLDQVTGNQPVTCAVCHDPHELGNVHQIRTLENVTLTNGVVVTFGGNGKICMNCHMSRRDAEEYVQEYSSHFGPHYSNQTDMLLGTNAITFGRYIPSSTHRDALDDTCVSCHMAATPGTGEPGHDLIGDHTFAMYTEEGGTRVDNVAACERCHGTLASFEDIMARADYDEDGEIESAKHEIHGLLDLVGELLPPLGEPEVEVTPDYSPLQLKTAYNYFYVEEDGSGGMHNFQFSVNLLKLTRDVLIYGVLTEGSIAEINDVPNDQGKQVYVSWNRFGGDGPSDNPLQMYYVWREVDDDPSSKGGDVYASFADVPADPAELGEGARVMFGDGMWTQVGSQPAAQMEMYSAIVPTLYDSTASGTFWSTFVVSGHAADNTTYVASLPMSGYSIDNLVPAAPAGLAVTRVQNEVVLQWDEGTDPDLDYIAIYRSETPGFDPTGDDPLATLVGTQFTDETAEAGNTYYYRAAAVDFSGNRSAFSAEVSISVSTGIVAMDGVPTDFELRQNYPNPFNPSTQITFEVPEAGDVRIAVYDVSGKEVAVLVDRPMAPGRYQVEWTAHHVASGVYFYKMESRGFVRARTMLLVK